MGKEDRRIEVASLIADHHPKAGPAQLPEIPTWRSEWR